MVFTYHQEGASLSDGSQDENVREVHVGESIGMHPNSVHKHLRVGSPTPVCAPPPPKV